MATKRDNPYGAFNFIVALGGEQGDGAEGTIVGGFSDASGLGVDVSYSEYRNGNEKFKCRTPTSSTTSRSSAASSARPTCSNG
jgi:hypothetical protein